MILTRVNALVGAGGAQPLTRGERGSMIGTLNKVLGGDAHRKIAVGWLLSNTERSFAPLSSKLISDSQARALYEWIGSWVDSDGVWHIRNGFREDAYAVLTYALKMYNEQNAGEKERIAGEKPTGEQLLLVAVADMGGRIKHVDGAEDIVEDDVSVLNINPLE